jgi:hypothetical protein
MLKYRYKENLTGALYQQTKQSSAQYLGSMYSPSKIQAAGVLLTNTVGKFCISEK